ncbi:MAG: hypothetical protein Q7S33_00390 [Nanoarchaeota archaeon]|nr:hypothetical protein [Nanoarchaeota archaeon]
MGKFNAVVQAPLIEKFHTDCLNCREPIFNPLCPECLTKAFEQWILKYPEAKEKTLANIKEFLKRNRKFNNNSQKCIVCKRKSVYLCPYCFTEFLLQTLKQTKVSKNILGEFLFLFNFDFNHNGYYKEGEKLGVF